MLHNAQQHSTAQHSTAHRRQLGARALRLCQACLHLARHSGMRLSKVVHLPSEFLDLYWYGLVKQQLVYPAGS